MQELAATLGISPEEAVEGVSLILDNWRRNRILHVTGDPIFSHYHAKDDPYIQAGLLPLREFRPEGSAAERRPVEQLRPGPDRPTGSFGGPGPAEEMGGEPEHLDVDAAATILWEFLTEEAQDADARSRCGRRKKSRLAGTCGRSTWRSWPSSRSQVRERCTTCQRITTRKAPKAACTRHNCHGTTVDRAAGCRELRCVAHGPAVRDGQCRRTHGPSARRDPQPDRERLQVPSTGAPTASSPRRRWKWASTSGPWTWP